LHIDYHDTVEIQNPVESCEEKDDYEKDKDDVFENNNIETMNAMEVDKEIIECGNCKSDKVKNEFENAEHISVGHVNIK
jgi:uncharacterized CHY-type Zn-finger protein